MSMFLILEEDFPDRLTTAGLLRHLRTRDMDPARALGAEVRHDFEENQPQLTLRIDRSRADDLDVPLEAIAQTLQTSEGAIKQKLHRAYGKLKALLGVESDE